MDDEELEELPPHTSCVIPIHDNCGGVLEWVEGHRICSKCAEEG